MSGESSPTAAAETRKLAAIMFTGMVGFSRQMGSDEACMLRLLSVHNQLIQQAVTDHHGTVIKTVGDAFLVDFPSVVHFAEGFVNLGNILAVVGRPEEGLGLIEKAMRLNPRYPVRYLFTVGIAYLEAGRCEESITLTKKFLAVNPNLALAHSNLAVCYAELDRLEEARAEVTELLRLNPSLSLEWVRQNYAEKDPSAIQGVRSCNHASRLHKMSRASCRHDKMPEYKT